MKVRVLEQDFFCRYLATTTRHIAFFTYVFDLFVAHPNESSSDFFHFKSAYALLPIKNIFPFPVVAPCNVFHFREGASNESSFLI